MCVCVCVSMCYNNTGKCIGEGEEVAMNHFDRFAIGGDIMLFLNPALAPADAVEPEMDDCIKEYSNAVSSEASAADR